MIEGFQLSLLLYNLGKAAGIMGFACLSFLIISGDTARFFDKYFGLDKIIKFQRKFSLFTATFLILHPLFFILSDSLFAKYLIFPDFTLPPLALGIISFYIFITVMAASLAYKRISNTVWQYIHILTYVLFFFSLYHAVNWGSDSSSIFIKSLYSVLFICALCGIVFRTQYKIRKYYSDKFYVKKIKCETGDTFSLILSRPKNFSFKAGQFCFLRLNKKRLYARHPFTISSAPGQQDLKFTIKNTGRFTEAVLNLKLGDEVVAEGPFGIFTPKDSAKNLLLIAGGVGITPFLSIIKNLQLENKKINVILLYGSKTKEDIICKKELDDIKENWLKKVYAINGHITESLIKKHVKDITGFSCYICGPEPMKKSVKKALYNLGVKKRDIIIEDFFW